MFCTECGAKNSAENKFCRQCGHALEKAKISEAAYTQALPEQEQAIELLENAYVLRKKGDSVGAVQQCERALKIAPESAAAHSLLGELYAAQGERERALQEYEQVLRLNPGSIADRLKRDELRDAGAAKAKRTAPLLAAPGRENAAPGRMTLVAVGAAALALVAAGVALSRSNHSSANHANLNADGANSPKIGPIAAGALAATDPLAPAASALMNGGAANSAAAGGDGVKASPLEGAGHVAIKSPQMTAKAANPNAFGPDAGLPLAKFNHSPFTLPSAPTQTLPAMPPAPAVPATKARAKKPADKKISPARDTDDRIVLTGAEGASDGGRYTIKINAGGAGGGSGGNGKNNVTMSKGNDADSPPAATSRSSVAIADDFRYKGEYDKAIQMYQRALPGAGDGAAHIYQQMAYCFQEKGDKSSAKVNYERAIEAYQKLAANGHNAESAQSAIRVCQRGLKICE